MPSKTEQMRARDERMFGPHLVRDKVYRGPDKRYTSKADITAAKPVDHGARPLLGKFSTFNLSYLLPEQRKVYLEQMKFELSLKGQELNDYLSQRYSQEDWHQIWLMQQKASAWRKKKLGIKAPVKTKSRKRAISLKQQAKKRTPEEQAKITAKMIATRKRNRADPNYASYATLQREFLRTQKLLSAREEARMKQAVAVFAEPTIKRKVYHRTAKLAAENQQLKEYLRQNNLPLPGTKRSSERRQRLRSEEETNF